MLSRQSPHIVYLERCIADFNMLTCIDIDHAQVPHTYIGPLSTSRIDHVLVSGIGGNIQCGTIDNHLHSDHVPIRVEFDFNIDNVYLIDRLHQPKPAWWRAKADHLKTFKERLESIIDKLTWYVNVIGCSNVLCDTHKEDISVMYNNVIEACIEAGECSPKTSRSAQLSDGGSIAVAGWTEKVEQLRRESLWWHSYWIAYGQPHEGEVAEKHRITRAQYHRAVKSLKNENDKMKIERMAEAVVSSNTWNLWNEVNKIKGRNNHKASDIDGINYKY